MSAIVYYTQLGSPPRMRGKGPGTLPGMVVIGITPAYAGKRCPRSDCVAIARDHPRVCGEKRLKLCIPVLGVGSPPRMRGKGEPLRVTPSLAGITPAYAGKSRLDYYVPQFAKDHPRVCGEKR